MGTKIGPNYASIFMGLLENTFLSGCSLKPFYYRRYIDDIFLIWEHGEAELLSFIAAFNNAHNSISFSHAYSNERINFLDVTVLLRDGQLCTTLYKKPTDRHRYLHFHSSHVKHCKTSIPYSQALRYKRICSEDSDFNYNCVTLKKALIEQKYPVSLIDDAFARADHLDRRALLDTSHRPNTVQQTNLILTHSASVPNVTGILRKHHNIIEQSDRLKLVFPDPPRVVYRRSKNLRGLLTSSKISHPLSEGCRPCNKPRCKICAHMTTSATALSTASNYEIKIRGTLCCDTSNVVYLLECSVCMKQYIGQTETSFRLRFNNHKAHCSSLPNLPLSKHVRIPGHSFDNIKVTILQSGFHTHHDRETRESYLIYKFNTVSAGLNESPGALSCVPR